MVGAVVHLNTDRINHILAILRSKDQQLLKSIKIEAVQQCRKKKVFSLKIHSVTSPRSCFVDFRRSIGSIRLSSNQQILLHNCIEKLHSLAFSKTMSNENS